MAELILQTKLNMPPLRAGLVPRPRLMDKLNVGLSRDDGLFNRKLTLVSAPAGFGKTTLVSYWLQEHGESTAWISLDEGDNEANRFVLDLLTALQDVHGALGRASIALLQAPQPPPPEALLTLLINDLSELSSRVILVLDDYHVIREVAIHKAVTFLLSNQPPQLHVVVVSREDPPLPLYRLRVCGEMAGIYA